MQPSKTITNGGIVSKKFVTFQNSHLKNGKKKIKKVLAKNYLNKIIN